MPSSFSLSCDLYTCVGLCIGIRHCLLSSSFSVSCDLYTGIGLCVGICLLSLSGELYTGIGLSLCLVICMRVLGVVLEFVFYLSSSSYLSLFIVIYIRVLGFVLEFVCVFVFLFGFLLSCDLYAL